MVLLDLYLLLFPRIVNGKRCHVCVHWRAEVRVAGKQPAIFALGITGAVGNSGAVQHRWAGYWQVAAKCGWRLNLCTAANAGRDWDLSGYAPRQRHAFFLAFDPARLAS